MYIGAENATNNSSNLNRNVSNCANNNSYSVNYDCIGDSQQQQQHFMSAWSEVWNDIEAIVKAAPELTNTHVHLDQLQLMEFPDDSVVAVAQSLVEQVYLSVSRCHNNDVYKMQSHQSKLVATLLAELDRRYRCPSNVRPH